jgi:hypothetical protein
MTFTSFSSKCISLRSLVPTATEKKTAKRSGTVFLFYLSHSALWGRPLRTE